MKILTFPSEEAGYLISNMCQEVASFPYIAPFRIFLPLPLAFIYLSPGGSGALFNSAPSVVAQKESTCVHL